MEYDCDECDYKATTKESIKTHIQSFHKGNQKKIYVSKRIKCNLCDKKFNKKETYYKHMKVDHDQNINQNTTNQYNKLQSSQVNLPFQKILRNRNNRNDLPNKI